MNNKATWVIVVIALVLIAVGIISNQRGKIEDSPALDSPTPQATATASPARSPQPGTTSPASSTISYPEALEKYANNRIQFDAACQATPNAITVKNGVGVMFDNRSGDDRWIALDGKGYFISGFGFRILPLTSKTLPHTTLVSCGSAQNVAQIRVAE